MHVSIFERAGASTITYFSPYGQQVHSHHITFVKFPLPQYLFTNTSLLITLIDCMLVYLKRAGASTITYFSPYVQQVHSHHITFVKVPLPRYLFTNTSMLITLIDCMLVYLKGQVQVQLHILVHMGQQVHSHHITFVKFPLPRYLFTNTSMLITLIDCMLVYLKGQVQVQLHILVHMYSKYTLTTLTFVKFPLPQYLFTQHKFADHTH